MTPITQEALAAARKRALSWLRHEKWCPYPLDATCGCKAGQALISLIALEHAALPPSDTFEIRDMGDGHKRTLGLGCGRIIETGADDGLVYRCASCRTAFHHDCLVQHFGWPEAGGGPMPHDLDRALAAAHAGSQEGAGEP